MPALQVLRWTRPTSVVLRPKGFGTCRVSEGSSRSRRQLKPVLETSGQEAAKGDLCWLWAVAMPAARRESGWSTRAAHCRLCNDDFEFLDPMVPCRKGVELQWNQCHTRLQSVERMTKHLMVVKFASETRVQQEGLQCSNRPGQRLTQHCGIQTQTSQNAGKEQENSKRTLRESYVLYEQTECQLALTLRLVPGAQPGGFWARGKVGMNGPGTTWSHRRTQSKLFQLPPCSSAP